MTVTGFEFYDVLVYAYFFPSRFLSLLRINSKDMLFDVSQPPGHC